MTPNLLEELGISMDDLKAISSIASGLGDKFKTISEVLKWIDERLLESKTPTSRHKLLLTMMIFGDVQGKLRSKRMEEENGAITRKDECSLN